MYSIKKYNKHSLFSQKQKQDMLEIIGFYFYMKELV